MSCCKTCKKELSSDEIGLSRKLINKETADYYCIDCLSLTFNCEKEKLEGVIERCKKSGCLLFL